MTTSAGTLVSSTRLSQIFTSTGFQLKKLKTSRADSRRTQTMVRTICMAVLPPGVGV